jgi:uncharacterized protein YfdQ (DUF2303 family)
MSSPQVTSPAIPVSANNFAPVIEIARHAGKLEATPRPEVRTIEGRECLVAPSGAITPLLLPDSHLEAPRRLAARLAFYEAASFCAYVNAHKQAGRTLILGAATETRAGFTALLDYHGDNVIGLRAPSWCGHSATLALTITPEWGRWMAKNATFLPQQAFAEHIEENLLDIIEPAAAEILEVAQGLQGMKNVSFKSGRNLRDGAIRLEYVEQIEIQGTTTRRDSTTQVPAMFKLQLVPFVGAAGVEIEARLRYRIGNDGSLSFAYILTRPYRVIETAFAVAREEIERATCLAVHLGAVEATK